jgi:hypothetical protein
VTSLLLIDLYIFPNSALYNLTGLDVRVRKIEPHVERDIDEGSA